MFDSVEKYIEGFKKLNPPYTGFSWVISRLKYVEKHYTTEFFNGAEILEVGCASAAIGNYFSTLGANVTVCDGRDINVDFIKSKLPHIQSSVVDLDKSFPFEKKYDLIINFGVLYHLENPQFLLEQCCQHSKHMALETEIFDSFTPEVIAIGEDARFIGKSLSGTGVRPSPTWVESHLRGKNYSVHVTNELNGGAHRYDGEIKNTREWKSRFRRFWFVWDKVDKYGTITKLWHG